MRWFQRIRQIDIADPGLDGDRPVTDHVGHIGSCRSAPGPLERECDRFPNGSLVHSRRTGAGDVDWFRWAIGG